MLQCDAPDTGLGATLLQNGQPVAYASRSLTDIECNYAQIEKELLAIVFGAEKFNQYTYGRKVYIESDHKPLEVIYQKPLVAAPKRLQRMQRSTTSRLVSSLVSTCTKRTLSQEHLLLLPSQEMKSCTLKSKSKRFKWPTFCHKESLRDVTIQALQAVIQDGWPETKTNLSHITSRPTSMFETSFQSRMELCSREIDVLSRNPVQDP